MYELHEAADLTDPVLVVAFEGWVGAGSVGITAAGHIAEEGPVIASFPPDLLYDYRVSRPKATFIEGALQELAWPSVTVRHRSIDGRDLLVLSGPEPNWHWQEFSIAVADLAAALGVVEQISLGGIPWAAPHTRPTVVVTTASQPDLVGDDANTPEGKLQVPAAIALAIESYLTAQGIPAVGFWARVPHYVRGAYHPGGVALVERVAAHTGIDIPLGSLVDDASAQRRQLAAALEARPEARKMVERYEQAVEARDQAASGQDIADEIERFLKDQAEGL